jgi:molybdenum cofactor biosynthesis enzyme MoaA
MYKENNIRPYVIFFSPCDNNCIFCSLKSQQNADHKSFKELKIQIDQIVNFLILNNKHLDNIFLIDGEPTLNDCFLDIVKYAASLGFKQIYLDTNGQKFSDENFCRLAIESGLTDINMPIYGHNALIHDSITRKKFSFLRFIKAIKNLKHFDVALHLHTLILKQNYKDLPQMARLIKSYNLPCSFNFFLPDEKEKLPELIPSYSQILPYLLKARFILNNNFKYKEIPECVLGNKKVIPEKDKSFKFIINSNKPAFYKGLDYASERQAKIKLFSCEKCSSFNNCEGVLKRYVEFFGINEFKPITNI